MFRCTGYLNGAVDVLVVLDHVWSFFGLPDAARCSVVSVAVLGWRNVASWMAFMGTDGFIFRRSRRRADILSEVEHHWLPLSFVGTVHSQGLLGRLCRF